MRIGRSREGSQQPTAQVPLASIVPNGHVTSIEYCNAEAGNETGNKTAFFVQNVRILLSPTDNAPVPASQRREAGSNRNRRTQPGAPNHPVLWNNGVIQALPELPGDNKGAALMINNSGQAVGYSANISTGIRSAVTWNNGMISQLSPLPGGCVYDEALGINAQGQVVGWSGTGSGLEHITRWNNGVATDLGTLGGA